MKKLMIAAAIVCAAALSQAAQVDWQLGKNSIYFQNGSAGKGMDCYLVLATAGETFNTFKADLASGKINADNIESQSLWLGTATTGTGSTTQGKIAKTPSENKAFLIAGQAYDVVFVSFDSNTSGDWYYMSGTPADQATAWGGSTYTEDLATPAAWMSADYSAANWHTVSAVPEPTSGLLLLLGVAGLALKRKRA